MGAKLNQTQEATTVEDMGSNVPRIYAVLDNQQVEHQSSMIKLEGMIIDMTLTILLDSRASFSYINSNIVMKCQLPRNKLP